MLSGFGFNNSGGAEVFNHSVGIASDGTHLLLADRWNNRILIWNSIPQSNVAPDLVLGQDDFNTNDPGTTLDKMDWPGSVSISSDGKLVVADSYNNRILVWNSFPTQNGQAADFEITDSVTWSWGVWTNGQKLIVSCLEGAKIWNTFPTNGSQHCNYTLTANGEFGTPRTITSNGDFLMIGDHNAKNANGPQGDYVWNHFPTSNVAYDYFTTDPQDKNYAWLQGGITSDSSLIALGKQLHFWKTIPTNASQQPDFSLTYNFDGGDGSDVAVVGTKVFVSAMNDNRVFVFNTIPTDANTQPDFVLGSPAIETNTLLTNHFITNPVPVSDGTHLFVSSDFDRSLSVWKTLPENTATAPDTVISLQDAPWDNELKGDTLVLAGKTSVSIWTTLPLQGQQPDITIKDHIGSIYFSEIKGVAFDQKYFYIADASKIYIWSGFPTSSSYNDPILTLYVVSPMKLYSDGDYLTITEMEALPPKILIYDVANFPTDTNPFKTIGGQSPYQYNLPMHSITANGHLFIANTIFNCVYAWKDLNDAGDYSKVIVLGSDSSLELTPCIGDSTLFWPASLSFDGKHLWVGEFKFSGRILRYTIPDELTSIKESDSKNNLLSNIKIYPNPTSDKINIDFSLVSNEEKFQVALFDYTGKCIKKYENISNYNFSIDINGFALGIYQLKISNDASIFCQKILIIK